MFYFLFLHNDILLSLIKIKIRLHKNGRNFQYRYFDSIFLFQFPIKAETHNIFGDSIVGETRNNILKIGKRFYAIAM